MDIMKVYHEVFDDNKNVKLCGRKKCIQLIRMCQEIDTGTNYGNLETGIMNVKAINSLIDKLKEE